MKRVTAMVLFGILAAAYSAGELNSTSLNQLTGKMPLIAIQNLADCILFIYDRPGKEIGLGVALENGRLISHKKFEQNGILYGVKFACRDYKRFKVLSLGSYKSVALMEIDPLLFKGDEVDFSYFPWAKLEVEWPQEEIIAKSVTIGDIGNKGTVTKESFIMKSVALTSGWANDVYRTRKLEENNSEKEGDLLFYGLSIIGILVEMPDSEGITTYQNLLHICQELNSHARTSTSETVYD